MLVVIYAIGAVCVVLSVSLSMHLLYKHLECFYKPEYQRHICRIILMVPVYALTSWFSMIYPRQRQFLNIVRDFYEAFVIYNFLMLLLNYVGGERKLTINLELKDYINHPWPINLFFHSFHPSEAFLRLVKVGTLQFVVCRPVLSAAVVLFSSLGLYEDSNFGGDDAFLYIFIVNNISFSAALYGLLLFYTATEEFLEPFSPIPKFLCIKLVIFFSFWQGIVLLLLEHFRVIGSTSGLDSELVSITVQEFLICIEMLGASVAHRWAFGYSEYSVLQSTTMSGIGVGVRSVLLAEDIIKEVKDSLSPATYDFELKT